MSGLFILRMTPEAYYLKELAAKEQEAAGLKTKTDNYSKLRLLLGVMFLLSLYFSLSKDAQNYYGLVSFGLLAGFLFVVRTHIGVTGQHKLAILHIALLKNELAALGGDYRAFNPGNEFIDTSHPYSFDLDIFGASSIFRMLCRSVTQNGYLSLAKLVQAPYADAASLTERSAAIAELSAKPDLLREFRVRGEATGEEKPQHRALILEWIIEDDKFINKLPLVIASIVMPITSAIFIILSIAGGTLHLGLLLAIMVNLTILSIYSKNIKRSHALVGRSVKLIDKYQQLMYVIAGSNFDASILKNCKAHASDCIPEITRFAKLVHLFDSRQNGMVGPLMNSFFLFDIYCLLRLEKWRKKSKEILIAAFDHTDIFDVHVSLAFYAFNHPQNNYPVIDEHEIAITAKDAKHPLIPAKVAIGNDFSIGSKESFYLLTGANMTGKSTFIRMVGTNLLLSYMGLPVPAETFKVPLIKLYTAIRISDSVQDDVSYFKAELNRLKMIMTEIGVAEQPYLILLDEPLRGTNSTDKQQGTRLVVERLIKHNAIGIVATHDTGLCDMEDIHRGKVSNYHFESAVDTNTLSFDYKIRASCSTSNNATILMRMMDII